MSDPRPLQHLWRGLRNRTGLKAAADETMITHAVRSPVGERRWSLQSWIFLSVLALAPPNGARAVQAPVTDLFVEKASFVWLHRGKLMTTDCKPGQMIEIGGTPISLRFTLAGTEHGLAILRDARKEKGRLTVRCQWLWLPSKLGVLNVPSEERAIKKLNDTPAGDIDELQGLEWETQSDDNLFDWRTRTMKLQELPKGKYEVRIKIAGEYVGGSTAGSALFLFNLRGEAK